MKLTITTLLLAALAGSAAFAQNAAPAESANSSKKTVTTVKQTADIDTNHDGVISKDEFKAQTSRSFDKMHKSATPMVQQTEFISFFCGEPVKDSAKDTKYHADCVAVRTRMFQAADTNHDGVVSKEEAMAYAEKQYSDADKNKDGVVTLDEYFTYTLTWDETKPEVKSGSGKPASAAKPAAKK